MNQPNLERELEKGARSKGRFVPENEKRPQHQSGEFTKSGNHEADDPLEYKPHWISGGAKHPGVLVEPPGLANVSPPPITYRPCLPKTLSEEKLLSEIQMERIIYAGQSHATLLPNGARAGISIGDGTGTGKTGTIAGIILDNWFQGRRRTVWFSVKTDLIEAVREEFDRIGFTVPVKLLNEYPSDQEISLREGIVFCTYRSLIARSKKQERRLDQIMNWLGPEGLEIFDEGHRAKNAFAAEGGKPTQTGEAVLEIQDPVRFPEIRVVYSSATAATEVRHLAYMTRLGLWGEGTSFPLGFAQFAEEIEAGGVGAMEMIARDLKALGRYFCGNLSMGRDPQTGLAVECREVTHYLTARQKEMYDSMARAWQEVLKNFNQALDLTNTGKRSRRWVTARFWAEHQRCFRNLITAFKVPTIIREIEDALSEKFSVVISITGTGEARTLKQIEGAIDREEAIDSLDFSPRETLFNLVENCFPVKVFQEISDPETGSVRHIPVMDDAGVQLESTSALRLKRELLDRLSLLEVPEHPLDQLVNYFGTENVAEMTGRKKRLIRTLEGHLEYRRRQIPGVPNSQVNLSEKNSFQGKLKRIAIMSEVASTGDSLHAGRRVNNRQRRLHIAAELKWSADKQVQDFGRTHRTGQVAPPVYLLIFTELGGEKRFSATIARRLSSLGALTKGDRRAEKAANLDKYNLESRPGRAALNVVLTRILNGKQIPGLMNPLETLDRMGLLKRDGEDGAKDIPPGERTNIPRFLNRLLSLEVDPQNALFDYFYQTFLETIEHLRSKGKLDDGLEDLKANSVRITSPPQILFEDALTGSQTVYYKLELVIPTMPVFFEEISRINGVFFYQNRRTGEFAAARPALAHTDPETGERYRMYAVSRPKGYNLAYVSEDELNRKYKIVPKGRAENWWTGEQKRIPRTRSKEIHLLSGALLPVWKTLKNLEEDNLKIVRTTTDDGIRLVGLRISRNVIGQIQKTFGVRKTVADTAEEVIRSGLGQNEIIELLGGIKLRKSRFQGRDLLEVFPASYQQIGELRETGLINIISNSKQRFFAPEEKTAALKSLESLLKIYPPLHLIEDDLSSHKGEKTSRICREPKIEKKASVKPVILTDWLIEPDEAEVFRIKTRENQGDKRYVFE